MVPERSDSQAPRPCLVFQVESDYCLLLALPCGRDQEDVVNQTESLKAAFISYLQAKQAAGIINVPNPGSNQVGREGKKGLFSFLGNKAVSPACLSD